MTCNPPSKLTYQIVWVRRLAKELCFPLCIAAQLQKVFLPHETTVFVRLLKYGLVALDIYRVTVLPNGVHILRNANCQTVKTKEEKEVLEHFAGVVRRIDKQI